MLQRLQYSKERSIENDSGFQGPKLSARKRAALYVRTLYRVAQKKR